MNTIVRWTLAGILGLSSFGCGEGCSNKTVDLTPSTEGAPSPQENTIGEEYQELPVEEQLQQIALQSQRAGYMANLVDAYLTPWAEDGVLVSVRTAESDDYAQKYDLRSIESSSRVLFSPGGPVVKELTHSDAKVVVNGSVASLTLRSTRTMEDETRVFGEKYQFEKASRGWEIKELRRWPISKKVGDEETLYGSSYFTEADIQVSLKKKEGEFTKTVDALTSSFRFSEAYAEYRKRFEEAEDIRATDWLAAAEVAIQSGHITSAMRCYEKANGIDPTLRVPEGGLVMRKIRGDKEYTEAELRTLRKPPTGPEDGSTRTPRMDRAQTIDWSSPSKKPASDSPDKNGGDASDSKGDQASEAERLERENNIRAYRESLKGQNPGANPAPTAEKKVGGQGQEPSAPNKDGSGQEPTPSGE